MSNQVSSGTASSASRRSFLQTSAMVGGVGMMHGVYAAGSSHTLRLGLIGCGGRGTGAAAQAMTADSDTKLVAMGDAFEDRLQRSLKTLKAHEVRNQVSVDPDHQFVGLDAFQKVIDSDVDVILLATPPHFRPQHLRAAIDANKHVFAEKPVAVDGPGVRSVLESTRLAKERNLAIVSGLCWRYEDTTQELMKRIHDGAIGEIFSAEAYRFGRGVWVRPRRPGMTEMQYQMHNWYYFTWMSGDFNVEQHVHELDKVAWMMGDRYPVSCTATGGRMVRTGKDYGHIYDSFSGVFNYDNGAKFYAASRHQPGCTSMNTTGASGTKGRVDVKARQILGENPFKDERPRTVMHQREHDAMYAALRRGEIINNGEYMAKSTLMAIMQRMSAYSGQTITWDDALNSEVRLGPTEYRWDVDIPVPKVAIPGRTRVI